MELLNVTQMNTKGRIPVFGIESKIKSKKELKQTPEKESGRELSAEDRCCLVALCAYYKAEARGFEPGHEMEDWLAAEAEVNQ